MIMIPVNNVKGEGQKKWSINSFWQGNRKGCVTPIDFFFKYLGTCVEMMVLNMVSKRFWVQF